MRPFVIGSDKLPGLAKLLEEMAELSQVLAKFITTDGTADYWSGLNLEEAMIEEMGDVLCALHYFADYNLSGAQLEAVIARRDAKIAKYEHWHSIGDPIPADGA